MCSLLYLQAQPLDVACGTMVLTRMRMHVHNCSAGIPCLPAVSIAVTASRVTAVLPPPPASCALHTTWPCATIFASTSALTKSTSAESFSPLPCLRSVTWRGTAKRCGKRCSSCCISCSLPAPATQHQSQHALQHALVSMSSGSKAGNKHCQLASHEFNDSFLHYGNRMLPMYTAYLQVLR